MDHSTPGFPVLHLPEFAQTHFYWVVDVIQPSHPLSSPSPPAFNLSSIRVFSNESVLLIRWPKYCTIRLKCFIFVFKISIDRRMDKDVVHIYNGTFGSVLSRVRLFVTPWTVAHQASLSITNTQSLLRLMSIESVMPSNHLILCPPRLLPPSIFPNIRVFSNEFKCLHFLRMLHNLLVCWVVYLEYAFRVILKNIFS